MAKKKDPAVAVLRYFETADVGQATLVLALAKDAISRRKGAVPATGEAAAATARGPRRVQRSGAAAGSVAATGTLVPPPPGHAPLPGA